MTTDTSMMHQRKANEPFRHFFPNVSFITSILLGISVSASLTLPGQASFFGRNEVRKSASLFAWSASINGGALVLSLLMQLLHTSPHFNALASSDEYKKPVRWIMGSVAWVSLLLAAGGMALVAEGLKIVQRQAGLALQWLLFGFCLPVLLFWATFRVIRGINKRRTKAKDVENQSHTLTDTALQPSIHQAQ